MTDIDDLLTLANQLRDAEQFDQATALLNQATTRVAPHFDQRQQHGFMLMFQWRLLLDSYPPAHAVLAAARDTQAALPDPSHQQLDLLIEMNELLKDSHSTWRLFVQLDATQPDLARRFAWRAMPAIIDAGDFALAARYLGGPRVALEEVNAMARSAPLLPAPRTAPRLAAELNNLTAHVRYSAAVLQGTGRAEEAAAARAALLHGLEADDLRAAAQLELNEPGAIFRLLADHQVLTEQHEGP